MSRRTLSRRQFLTRSAASAAAAAAFTIVPRHVLGGPGHTPPSDVITRGTIGTGGMGTGAHVRKNEPGQTPVQLAVCDVDRNHLNRALGKAGKPCRGYADWRRLLEQKDIDVIHVATPPHWHALITIAAIQAGYDVYCEKPMTRFIAEGRAVCRAVDRYGAVVQHNSYGRRGWERHKKLVDSGLLGAPLTVYLGPSTGYTFKVREWSGRKDLTPEPVPEVLDYDMWLGPAPFKPYHPHRVHGSFRGYWDYDGGGLSDMGQHWFDPVQYFLGKDDTGPVTIEALAPQPAHPDATGLWGRITYTYADGTKVIFESGEWGTTLGERPFIEGPKGRIFRGRGKREDPAGLFNQLAQWPDPPALAWFDDCVRSRRNEHTVKPNAHQAHRSVSVLHLGNIAIRLGRTIRWDPAAERVVGDDEANRLVDVPMRAPWRL